MYVQYIMLQPSMITFSRASVSTFTLSRTNKDSKPPPLSSGQVLPVNYLRTNSGFHGFLYFGVETKGLWTCTSEVLRTAWHLMRVIEVLAITIALFKAGVDTTQHQPTQQPFPVPFC